MAYNSQMDVATRQREEDDFFKAEEGLMRTYVFDYDKKYSFQYDLSKRTTCCVFGLIPYCWPFLPFVCCWMESNIYADNVRDQTLAQHVAITHDGIKFVTTQYKKGCRFDCEDQGKISKTVPFDKITDCDVEEPAGSSGPCCCMVKNVLMLVNIDTASSGGAPNPNGGVTHELSLSGLIDPHQFKKDVWSMKRTGQLSNGSTINVQGEPVHGNSMDREIGYKQHAQPVSSSAPFFGNNAKVSQSFEGEAVPLLREQNSILTEIAMTLKAQNALLKK